MRSSTPHDLYFNCHHESDREPVEDIVTDPLIEELKLEQAVLDGIFDRNTHRIREGGRNYHALMQIRAARESLAVAVSWLRPVDV